MKTLSMKCDGHEVQIPYELPDSLRFDCFVPGMGVLEASVDLREDDVEVVDVRTASGAVVGGKVECRVDVIEQAGDVCAVFERALGVGLKTVDPTTLGDAPVLYAIARIAVLESDLHTEWCRLPDAVTNEVDAPSDEKEDGLAFHALAAFITKVLVPRAQDMATAAAKNRSDQWMEEQADAYQEHVLSGRTDAAIKRAKEEGR